MRVRFAVRIVGNVAALAALPLVGATLGRGGLAVGIVLAVVGGLFVWFWLPRMAHVAFEAGAFRSASRRYAWVERLAVSARRERAALLSRTGCLVELGDLDAADRLLGALDGGTLVAAERAVWLNNRACAVLAAGRDPHEALALADEASALRPDVPALQHTRGMALMAVGRVEDAITVLDGMRAGGELSPRLEADRCRELARAWTQKGEEAYAEDYRRRAEAFSR